MILRTSECDICKSSIGNVCSCDKTKGLFFLAELVCTRTQNEIDIYLKFGKSKSFSGFNAAIKNRSMILYIQYLCRTFSEIL